MKFNTRTQINKGQEASVNDEILNNPDFTRNFEGGIAFKMDKYTELYTRVATCLVGETKFYKETKEGEIVAENQDDYILKLIREIAKENPEFILKLAVFARQQLFLRSIPIVLLAECCLIEECKKYVSKYASDIIRRPDDATEFVVYFKQRLDSLEIKD